MGHDGAGEGNPYKVDKAATSSKEVKIEDCLFSLSVLARIFPQYASKQIR